MSDSDRNGMTLAHQASQAVYAIQKAVEAAEGDCTVIEFNDSSHLVSQTGSRPSPTKQHTLNPRGGTDPTQAIKDTYVRLRSVEAYHKVVVVVSDGEWHRGGDVMADLSDTGVITMSVQLDPMMNTRRHDNDRDNDDWLASRKERREWLSTQMGCEYNIVVEDCRDMVPLFEEVVVSEMEKAMNEGEVR